LFVYVWVIILIHRLIEKQPKKKKKRTNHVSEVLPRNGITGVACFQVVLNNRSRIHQVTRVERVHSVPTLGTKLDSFNNHRVEVAQTKQNGAQLDVLELELIFIEGGKGSLEVLFQSLGRLIGEFERSF
jgi:hypothetical protein